MMAGLPDAANARAAVTDPATVEALTQLEAAVDGHYDAAAARSLLRQNATSQGVQSVLWLLGFQVQDQSLIDAVTAVSIPVYFQIPYPPMELVVDGARTADYSLRLPRWPMAESSRLAPKRPYLPGVVTIEPVYRPK